MNFNHLSKNLITKGWLNISILTKGFILPNFKYIIYTKKRKTGNDGYGLENLYKDINNLENKEIDYIDIVVNWNKVNTKYDKKIYIKLIEKKIEIKLLNKLNKKIKINAHLI